MKASNDSWLENNCRDEASAATTCAQLIGQNINRLLQLKERISLFVSGGKSPTPIFHQLSEMQLAWNLVKVHLVDERFAPHHPEDLNETLVRQHLLKSNASTATFVPLLSSNDIAESVLQANAKTVHLTQPDIVLLGMGLDGHTASLFPDAPDFQAAMSANDHYVMVHPTQAPHPRISISFNWLCASKTVILFIPGSEKSTAFNEYLASPATSSPVPPLLRTLGRRATIITSGGQ